MYERRSRLSRTKRDRQLSGLGVWPSRPTPASRPVAFGHSCSWPTGALASRAAADAMETTGPL